MVGEDVGPELDGVPGLQPGGHEPGDEGEVDLARTLFGHPPRGSAPPQLEGFVGADVEAPGADLAGDLRHQGGREGRVVVGGLQRAGRAVDAAALEALGVLRAVEVARVAQEAFHVAEGVLVGDQFDTGGGAARVQPAQVVRGER